MYDNLYLAWRYLQYQKWRTGLLVACVALVIYLPVALYLIIRQTHFRLMERSVDTPLVLGARGSPLELVLNTLYFESRSPPTITVGDLDRIDRQLAQLVVPLHVRFRARQYPIVGTTYDYFAVRSLQASQGRFFGMLGECVLGASVARRLGLKVGDTLLSSPESFVTLAGVYPLKMHVVGILAPTGGADDRAVFVDIKTAWVIEGLGHGHQDLTTLENSGQILSRTQREITANASVMQYNEITAENVHTFHFHGDPAKFPLTAAIVLPRDERSATLLVGRFSLPDAPLQLVVPTTVIGHLMDTVFAVRRYLLAAALLVNLATLIAVGLIFALTVRLRRREIETLVKLGASPWRIRAILGCELLLVLCIAAVTAGALAWLSTSSSTIVLRLILRS